MVFFKQNFCKNKEMFEASTTSFLALEGYVVFCAITPARIRYFLVKTVETRIAGMFFLMRFL